MTMPQLIYCVKCDIKGSLFNAAQAELLAHGRPLHYQMLHKILMGRYPELEIKVRQLLKTLKSNPIFFQNLDEGVFRAIPVVYL
jgi:hypothetical protein